MKKIPLIGSHQHLFHENKYSRWYFDIIESASFAARVKLSKEVPNFVYYESHHIIPKSIGGADSRDNLVLLSSREHLLCHLLLKRMCKDPQHKMKMSYACKMMFIAENPLQNRKSSISQILKNKSLSVRHTNETIARIAEKNTGQKRTIETRLKMSQAALGQSKSTSTRLKMSESKRSMSAETKSRIGSYKKGIPLSDEHKKKLSESHKRRFSKGEAS